MKRHIRRVGVGIIGGIILLAGIIMIPYPGPGWVVTFAGLGVLSTEFAWAQRVLHYARQRYDRWSQWLQRQSLVVRGAVWCGVAVIVVVTIWLLNGYGLIDSYFHLEQDWLDSPLFS